MDYIQEELRRQREALAGLLLGGALPQGEDGGRSSGHAAADTPTAAWAAVPAAGASFSGRGQGSRPTEGGALSAGSGRSAVFEIPEAGGRTVTAGGTANSRETVGSREGVSSGETAESAHGAGWTGPAEHLRRSWESGRLAGTVPPDPAGVWRGAETPDRREARRTAGGAVLERTVTEFIRAESGGSAPGAEALSRAFQRDARRYDGGFSLY